MNTPTLIQFPSGEESTLDEWAEQPEAKPLQGTELSKERDKFLLWEIRRNLAPAIGKLLTSTQ